MKKILLIVAIIIILAAAGFFVFWKVSGTLEVSFNVNASVTPTPRPLPEKLKNPPVTIKGIYATSWTAGTEKSIDYLIDLIKKTELNAIVIDIKDYTGYISFDTELPFIKNLGTEKIQIKNFNDLIDKLHQNNIYVIARISVFQDPALTLKRPDLAIKSKKTGAIWKDRNGISWLDPASPEVWNYILTIAKEVNRRGVDELNFDYIRFPSDGDMQDLAYPFYDEKTPKKEVLREFFQYLSDNLRPQGVRLSADLFGLTIVNPDDLGIGQVLEDAAPYFDFICPMVYPSHYASGFLGYKNPAEYPYEVIKYSLEAGKKRLMAMTATPTPKPNATSTPSILPTPKFTKVAELRPWLQDFDMGAVYNEAMVRLEKKAVSDTGLSAGWLFWDPKNVYTVSAFDLEQK